MIQVMEKFLVKIQSNYIHVGLLQKGQTDLQRNALSSLVGFDV